MTDSHMASIDANALIGNDKDNDVLDYLSVDVYDYQLPASLIARYTLVKRFASKLLYLPADTQTNDNHVEDCLFSELPNLLESGDLIVFNDTKVMKARLFGQKDTGGKLEALVERLVDISDLDSAALHLKDTNDAPINQNHKALNAAKQVHQMLK